MSHSIKEVESKAQRLNYFKGYFAKVNKKVAVFTTLVAVPMFITSAFVLLMGMGFLSVLAGDSDHIRVKDTAFCLNTPYREDNGNVFVWTCDPNDPDQDWEWYGELLRLKGTNFCLNTPHRYNEGNVFLWTCNSGDADQKWQRDGELIRLKDTNYCLNNPSAYRQDGGNVNIYTCNSGDPDQKWIFGGSGGACPSSGWYCGGSVGENPDNLYYCSGTGAIPTLDQVCDNGCQVNDPGTPDECINGACPSGGWYCGGSIGEDPNNLYYCTSAGAIPTLDQECTYGCQVNEPGTPDECINGSCPSGGWYCGGSVGEDPNNLYYCTSAGADPVLDTVCSNGCQVNEPGTPDECVSSSCPGYGWWCGGSIGEDPDNLYFCSGTGATPQLEEACANGCQVNEPGVPDQCVGVGACPDYGWWCGGSVGMNPDYLYYCSEAGVSPTLNEACSDGCQINDPGVPDQCSGQSCPGYGWWCGESVGGNPNYLYFCSDDQSDPQLYEVCDSGCQVNDPGTPDQCSGVGSCPGYGWWCGESIGGNTGTLYFCTGAGANPTVQEVCSDGCKVNSLGTPDQCYNSSGGTCPTDGWYCGETVGLDPNSLYQCNSGVASLYESCSNGCQINPPGTADICVPSGSGPCADIADNDWTGPGDYCLGDTLVTCTVNRDTVYQEYCGVNRCQHNSPAMCVYDPIDLPEGQEVLNPSGVSNLYWPFNSSSWNDKNGWAQVFGSKYHFGCDVYAQDWSWGNGLDDDCGKDFISPISGTVIYSAEGSHAAYHVVVRSSINPDMALFVGHLQEGSLIANGSEVNGGKTVLGRVGKTGTDNCHPHIVLYKNISGQCGSVSVLDRLMTGYSACWGDTYFAADFELNYMGPDPRTSFVFPISYWQDHKIEKDFGFGGGPIDEWKNCHGVVTQTSSNDLYHAGLDIISSDALGTNELNAGNLADVQACERGALNSQVIAAGAGEVVVADEIDASATGSIITIKHYVQEDGLDVYSTYLHVKYRYVNVGDKVKVGQPIAYVGDYSNNPHLHFEMKKFAGLRGGYTLSSNPEDEGYINPCKFITEHGGSVPASCPNMYASGGSVSNLYSSALTSFLPGATSDDLVIQISNLEEPTVSQGSASLIVNHPFIIKAQDKDGNLVTNFLDDVTLEFQYFLNALRHVDASSMNVYYLNSGTGTWVPLPTTLDLLNQKVSATTNHYTEFAIIGDYVNNAPDIVSTPITSVMAGDPYEYDVEASDLDQDTLIYSLSQAPLGMQIDPNNGLIQWAPTIEDFGSNSVVVEVSDSDDATTQTFTIDVSKPTAVFLESFDVRVIKSKVSMSNYKVDVLWTTALEINNIGFNLYRKIGDRGKWMKINRGIIPAQFPGSIFGADYIFHDNYDYLSGRKYFIKLESIEIGGSIEEVAVKEIVP